MAMPRLRIPVCLETGVRFALKRRLTESPISPPNNWSRPVVRAVRPQVDGGRRPAKTTVGEYLTVEADAFVDGHESLVCDVRARHAGSGRWTSHRMQSLLDDRWRGSFPVTETGLYRFSVRARIDEFATWRDDLKERSSAGQDLTVELQVGADIVERAAGRARAGQRRLLELLAESLRSSRSGLQQTVPPELATWAAGISESGTLAGVLFQDLLGSVIGDLADPDTGTTSEVYGAFADVAKARFSSWYELFPRSTSQDAGRHGTFGDVRRRLDYVEQMGFDVLYLPPIHPIGTTARKGREGAPRARADDPGSPWAIGNPAGGHTAIHPELGTLADFRSLVSDARARGIDVAIDLAFQASPDHPWVREHPEWFKHRPDGTIRFAENPPKRYEDIYPFDFESQDWSALWLALRDVVSFWVEQGVRIFRVDNPHTKPFPFWEWLISSIRAGTPEVIFLSEAFTRPRVMEQLARIGFTQSYTYFTWRTSKWELETYLTELTCTDMADYFRPNLWPNTPDILSEELQTGGRPAFIARLVLAATLSSSYGIYGPAFELQEHLPRSKDSEEYLRSEKYEIRCWDLESPASLSAFIALVNKIRRDHEALQFNDRLHFHPTDNDQLIAYSKVREGPEESDVVLTVVNLDHHHTQSGWVTVDLDVVGFSGGIPYTAHDLLSDARFTWTAGSNFVSLDPLVVPCHILALTQEAHSSAVTVGAS
jgi:starch synthase (maltosyl-transferring)